MKASCPRCGSKARVRVRWTWREVGEGFVVVAVLLGVGAIGVLLHGWQGMGGFLLVLLILGCISAGWDWLRRRLEEMKVYGPHGWYFFTGAEREPRWSKKLREEKRRDEEVRNLFLTN